MQTATLRKQQLPAHWVWFVCQYVIDLIFINKRRQVEVGLVIQTVKMLMVDNIGYCWFVFWPRWLATFLC